MACPSTSPPPMKKNKTDQHKSPCKLTACKGFSFSHYSHHPTSQQATHHQQPFAPVVWAIVVL